jgi:hypothetical protein
MPDHTECLILELITEALAAESEDDVKRVLPELRAALRQHIRLARESLIIVLPR